MSELKDIFGKRKHPNIYSDEIIPTENEIRDIVTQAYPLVTSFRKAFAYEIHVLGPNKERSNELWKICEGHKQKIDDDNYGDNAIQIKSMGMLHINTAPWILIATPRVTEPNGFHKDVTGKSHWEFADWEFMNRNNRESGALEIGMIAKMIMGFALQRGWDSGYCVCFPKSLENWQDYPFLKFYPTLIQTIGKATKYEYQCKTQKEIELNTAPPLETIFKFYDSIKDDPFKGTSIEGKD